MKMGVFLYIDPGTGSMLFAILIGILSAMVYLVKSWWLKIKFAFSSGKQETEVNSKFPFVIFADDKRYWNVFKPVIEELDRRGFNMVYMTASKDDPGLKAEYEHLRAEFIGEGNRAFAKLNMLNATMVLSTTPGLDVYQWKRSKDVDFYIHILHACDGVMAYRMFGLDYYDAVMISGKFYEEDTRALEKLRSLPAKELCYVGIPFMDEMVERKKMLPPAKEEVRTVLLAPSWGPSSIFNRYGEQFIEELNKTGYKIIIRPHPQSYTSEKALIDRLMERFPNSDTIEWNRDNDNFAVQNRADILISDFSGITFEFSLVFDKPVIYADTEFDKSPYDAWWLDKPYWTFEALNLIGMKLDKDNFANVKQMIDECIEDPKYKAGRENVKSQTWMYPGEGAHRAADYIMKKYDELTSKEGR